MTQMHLGYPASHGIIATDIWELWINLLLGDDFDQLRRAVCSQDELIFPPCRHTSGPYLVIGVMYIRIINGLLCCQRAAW